MEDSKKKRYVFEYGNDLLKVYGKILSVNPNAYETISKKIQKINHTLEVYNKGMVTAWEAIYILSSIQREEM